MKKDRNIESIENGRKFVLYYLIAFVRKFVEINTLQYSLLSY
jgi:hypothetical protein